MTKVDVETETHLMQKIYFISDKYEKKKNSEKVLFHNPLKKNCLVK